MDELERRQEVERREQLIAELDKQSADLLEVRLPSPALLSPAVAWAH
jgi:hypothetical protein